MRGVPRTLRYASQLLWQLHRLSSPRRDILDERGISLSSQVAHVVWEIANDSKGFLDMGDCPSQVRLLSPFGFLFLLRLLRHEPNTAGRTLLCYCPLGESRVQ